MQKLAWTILTMLAMSVAVAPAQETLDARGRGPIDQEHTNWIDHVMRSISTITPGMTRKDLFAVFSEEGGLSTPRRRTYVYRHCPYIKVDLEFSPADIANPDATTENPEDTIVKLSLPYMEYVHVD
jgi:hypothetical protein